MFSLGTFNESLIAGLSTMRAGDEVYIGSSSVAPVDAQKVAIRACAKDHNMTVRVYMARAHGETMFRVRHV